MVDLNERIAIDSEIRGGKPCIRGTRITVYDTLGYTAGRMSEREIQADFPSLTSERLRAALMFAAQRERRMAASRPCLGSCGNPFYEVLRMGGSAALGATGCDLGRR